MDPIELTARLGASYRNADVTICVQRVHKLALRNHGVENYFGAPQIS
jgi:hypothetical protein